MRVALTGGSGGIGRAIAAELLRRGDSVVSIDRAAPAEAEANLRFVEADIADYEALVKAFAGCEALIHMAAIPSPMRHADHIIHNNNVVGSYNALRAAVENGIMRICQASSVNAIGLSFSRAAHFDYFPVTRGTGTTARSRTASPSGSASSRPTASPGAMRASASPRCASIGWLRIERRLPPDSAWPTRRLPSTSGPTPCSMPRRAHA